MSAGNTSFRPVFHLTGSFSPCLAYCRHYAPDSRQPTAHRSRVVQCFLQPWFREIESLRQKVHPQYRSRVPSAGAITSFRIHRCNQRARLAPGHNAVHLREKSLPTGGHAVFLKARGQLNCLLIIVPGCIRCVYRSDRGLFQRFPPGEGGHDPHRLEASFDSRRHWYRCLKWTAASPRGRGLSDPL